jgi:hypothetical protein
MASTPRHLKLALLAAILGALLCLPAGALAATCDASEMIDAAANGRQIAPHSSQCYQQALASLPGDLDSYDPAVRANLISAMRRDASATSQRSPGNARALQALQQVPDAPAAAIGVRGPVTSLLEGLGPAHADQVPVPVLALGGAALLLLLAGLGTTLSRVRQRRLAR